MSFPSPMSHMSEQKVMDKTVQGDLMVNNLIYKQPKALSLAVNRTMKRQLFQKSSYTASEIARIDWNTGSDYVNPHNSYLTFKVLLTGTTPTGNFGNGSAVNFIERITITTRSGTELDRIERCNLWSKQETRHTYGQDWITKYGSMAGFGATGVAATDAANLSATATRFVIPLSLLSKFFTPTSDQLIPPMLASGLQIEISFADYRTAVFQKGGTVTGYTISDISIMADCVTLADDTQKTLNSEAAKSGLEYTYPRIYTSTQTVASTAVNAQIRKAVSQATQLNGVLLTQADVLDVTKDSLKSEAWNVSDWSYRLGGLYFPNQTLKDSSQDGLESFFISQACYDKGKHGHAENSVSLTDFTTNGYAQMSANFEKDQSLNLSGLPINNSRVAELNGTLASYSAPIELVVFLQYTAVCKCFLDNAVVAV